MKLFSRTVEAALMLLGTIVGAGMFGIPYVFVQGGFLTGAFVLAALALAVAAVHLAYAEVALRTRARHTLPGYARRYLGDVPGAVAVLLYVVGLSGSLLAYLLLGGAFLEEIIRTVVRIPAGGGVGLFYALGVITVGFGLRAEGRVNAAFTAMLVLLIAVFAYALLPHVSGPALLGFHPAQWFVPYGVVLFSLYGAGAVPEVARLAGLRRAGQLPRIVLVGTWGAALLYILFAASVGGALGSGAGPNPVPGLFSRFGTGIGLLTSAIGFLAAITSFIPIAGILEELFSADLKLGRGPAFILTFLVPGILYLLGFQNFIAVISAVGALMLGTEAIFILLMHARAQRSGDREPAFSFRVPFVLRALLILVFAAGIARAI